MIPEPFSRNTQRIEYCKTYISWILVGLMGEKDRILIFFSFRTLRKSRFIESEENPHKRYFPGLYWF